MGEPRRSPRRRQPRASGLASTASRAGGQHGGARREAAMPSCPKRPFATHADRLRPRLEDRRLPVAGPAARRPVGRGHRRRGSTSATTSPPASMTTGRGSTAVCALSGRATCSWSGSSTASAATSPIWSTPCRTCRPAAWPAGARRPGRADRHHHRGRPTRVRHLRGAGRVRAGADPRTHRGQAQGRTGSRTQGRQEVRAVESPGAAGSGRDGPPRHVGVRTVPRTRHQAGDALQVRRTAGPVA